jgi:hypothetical protein
MLKIPAEIEKMRVFAGKDKVSTRYLASFALHSGVITSFSA